MKKLRGVAVGAGYFSQFHFDAWNRIEEVELVGVCDLDPNACDRAAQEYGIANSYSEFERMLDVEQPDFVDIITRPDSHLGLVKMAAERNLPIICQKALAPTYAEAKEIVAVAEAANVPFMVHDNFRFQPWYREIKKQIDKGAIGAEVFCMSFRSRMGDGWGEDAYLDRQPYFREMPRLLIFEAGVHWIDTYRYLMGEIAGVYSTLQKLNPVIAGEDAGLVLFEFDSGARGVWDANRYNEADTPEARFTFGEALVEGSGGTIRLDLSGRLTLQRLGESVQEIPYACPRKGFAADCVYATQKHFVECLVAGAEFETSGKEYLKTLEVVEAVYQSNDSKLPVRAIGEQK